MPKPGKLRTAYPFAREYPRQDEVERGLLHEDRAEAPVRRDLEPQVGGRGTHGLVVHGGSGTWQQDYSVAGEVAIVVPEPVASYTTSRVLTMDYIDGQISREVIDNRSFTEAS